MTAAVVIEIVANPFAYCGQCSGELHYRANGRNMPCGCAALVGSVCPTWDPFAGCQCPSARARMHLEEIADAEALQDALEQQEQELGLAVTPPAPGTTYPCRSSVVPVFSVVPDLGEITPGIDPPTAGDDTIRSASELQIVILIVLSALILLGLSSVMVLVG